MQYEIYLYNIPKISMDGKQAISVPDSQVKEFAGVDDARAFAAEHKNKFDRVVLMQKDSEGLKMVERYVDGQSEQLIYRIQMERYCVRLNLRPDVNSTTHSESNNRSQLIVLRIS